MRAKAQFCIVVLISVKGQLLFGQATPPGKVDIQILESRRPTLSPEPGVRVSREAVSGDIVVTGPEGPRAKFVNQRQYVPNIQVQVESMQDRLRYSYTVANAPGAPQAITLMMFFVRHARPIEAIVPDYWRGWASGVTDGVMGCYAIRRSAEDNDTRMLLTGGRRAGPFILVSRALPGLIKLRLSGSEITADNALPEGTQYDGLTPWAQQEVLRLQLLEAQQAIRYVVGPKLWPEEDSLDRVRQELVLAATLEPFRAVQVQVSQAATLTAATEIRSSVEALRRRSVQTAFFDAMLLRLDRLGAAAK